MKSLPYGNVSELFLGMALAKTMAAIAALHGLLQYGVRAGIVTEFGTVTYTYYPYPLWLKPAV